MYFEYRIVKIEKGLFLIEYKTAPFGVWHEIDKKFKTKRLDGKGWVEGSLIRSTTGIKERAYIVDNFSSMSDYSVISVDPSTVCQFTGLKDKEGNEIWENDIVIKYSIRGNTKRVVVWDSALCAYVLKDILNKYNFDCVLKNAALRVIGNKFDKEKVG